MEAKEKMKMRKRNMKIFPMYKALSWDYLFYYTIDFMFLTQIKNINASDVILKDSFYGFFSIVLQIPANIVVEFLGRRNSLILGNILNCIYMVVLMLSRNLGDLIIAEFISAMAFSIKEIVQPTLLNLSIPLSKYKDSIYSKINSKGASRYYFFNAISKIVAGYLFVINGYLPMICSLSILIFVTVLSILFIEPVTKHNKKRDSNLVKKQLKEIKDGFKFVLKSDRLKALLLCGSLISALLSIGSSYHVGLWQDLKMSPVFIGVIAACGSFISALASKRQEKFHKTLRNKSLSVISYLLASSFILFGVYGLISKKYTYMIVIVVFAQLLFDYCNGTYSTIIDRYLKNFTNKEIDTKIFANKNIFRNIFRIFVGVVASFLISRIDVAYCSIIIGCIFTIIYFLVGKYMKTRVGLKPEQYNEEERRYDDSKMN